MKLGIGSYCYAWSVGVPGHAPSRPMTAMDLVEKAVELGVSVVQICDNLPLDRLSESELDRLARRADEAGVQIEVGTRGIGQANLETHLALARRFRSPILRAVIDTADCRPSLDEAIAMIRPLLPQLARDGVVLAIENHDRFSARQFCGLLQRLDSPQVGICLDTVNSFGALEGPEVIVAALAPWTVSLHVKDFTIRRVDHQMGFVIEGCPAGEGRLNVGWLKEQLRAAGRNPNAILELWPSPEPTLEQTIEKEHRWVVRSIANLKSLLADGTHRDSP